jgi:hypothetical protein
MTESSVQLVEEVHTISQLVAALGAWAAAIEDVVRAAALRGQGAALADAIEQMQWVRDFIGAPHRILGNPATKHGEIAEWVEICIRRSRQVLMGQAPTVWKDALRTGPADYVIDGVDVQSKFVNGVSQNLGKVLQHMQQYPSFGRDGSYYHVPRDHYDLIEKALTGERIPGLNARTLSSIADSAADVRRLSGRAAFEDVVQPSQSSYAEVQLGKVRGTLAQHERNLTRESDALEDSIRAQHGPTLLGAAEAAGNGAAVGAAVRFVANVYSTHKAGRRIWKGEYSAGDWKRLGLDVAAGGLVGSASAAAIYALTQCAELAAPFAAVLVSTALAIAELTRRYHAEEISFQEFCDLGQVTCLEGAVVGLAAATGQTLLPVVGLGAAVGAIAGRLLVAIAKDLSAKDSKRLGERMRCQYTESVRDLDHSSRDFVASLVGKYEALGELTASAFDRSINVQLRYTTSISLARAHDVEPTSILASTRDVDCFMS